MWFDRKTGNRRLGRGHVLDVKLRTKEVRATRLKLAATALGIFLIPVFYVVVRRIFKGKIKNLHGSGSAISKEPTV